MKIDKVMIAGMDDNTSIKELENLKEQFPFVEWGVLFSKHRAGEQRYPTKEWLDEFIGSSTGMMSAHFCGAYPREILEQGDFNEIRKLYLRFDSVQLNYNFSRSNKWSYDNLYELIRHAQAEDIFKLDIILQNNKSNRQVVEKFDSVEQVRILHDASGGRGTEIKNIEAPQWENYTGFAGGINKDNIVDIAKKVIQVDSDVMAWLDLESGARDNNNEFSIENCKIILDNVSKYITK